MPGRYGYTRSLGLLSAPVTLVNPPPGAPDALDAASITATVIAASGWFALQVLIANSHGITNVYVALVDPLGRESPTLGRESPTMAKEVVS